MSKSNLHLCNFYWCTTKKRFLKLPDQCILSYKELQRALPVSISKQREENPQAVSEPSVLFSHGIVPQQNETGKELGTDQPPREHQLGNAFCSFCPQF